MTKSPRCPKCHATLPRRGRFCLECGLDLYEEGVHAPPRHLIPIAVVLAAVAAIAIYAATRTRRPQADPEREEVARLTAQLLELAEQGRFRTIVTRFYAPDKERYTRVDELLREIVRGAGAPGLNIFQTNAMNDPDEADKFVGKYGTPHPKYVAGLLGALKFRDGALMGKWGATFGAQRTEDFVCWYLRQAFRTYDLKGAKMGDIRWQPRGDAPPLMVATIQCAEAFEPIPGLADPRTIAWLHHGKGKWTLDLGIDDLFLLEEVLNLLGRVKIG